jgi:transcriptional regulator with XRE-family HTH domain
MAANTEKEYLSQLAQIQSNNPPSIALLSNAEKVYNIDLSAREIDAPKFLSVAKDHKSETIYFRVDRYFDYMDLANTTCIIQYITPDKEPHIYIVPFYDIMTEREENKMLLPWCIDGAATENAGDIQYSVRFYIVESDGYDVKLIYNLNTVPSVSKVLHGMEVTELSSKYDIEEDPYFDLIQRIQAISREGVYWDILD